MHGWRGLSSQVDAQAFGPGFGLVRSGATAATWPRDPARRREDPLQGALPCGAALFDHPLMYPAIPHCD